MKGYDPRIHKQAKVHKEAVITIQGKIKRETDKAILVETHTPEGDVKDIWYPLSQVRTINRTFSAINHTLDSLVITHWIARQKNLISEELAD